jgi:Zn-dependent membrane protease YugP
LFILGALALGAILLGPTLWVSSVMATHGKDRPDFPGTGGELARHLLDENGLSEVPVEITQGGDHYDPVKKTVLLSRKNHEGRSVTAVAVAAHEVSHAIQDKENYAPLKWRENTVKTAAVTDRIGSIALMLLSVLGGAVVAPRILLIGLIAVVLMGLVRVAAHMVTLPVELDASFKRALPTLENGRYLHPDDMQAARTVLKAAAFTYVAASLMEVLNFFRLIRYWR